MGRYRAVGGPMDGQLVEMAEHMIWFRAPVIRPMGVFDMLSGKHHPAPQTDPEHVTYELRHFHNHLEPASYLWVAKPLGMHEVMELLLQHYKPFADLVQRSHRYSGDWTSPKARAVKGNFTA